MSVEVTVSLDYAFGCTVGRGIYQVPSQQTSGLFIIIVLGITNVRLDDIVRARWRRG
jgi:hypothetical protein